MKPKTDNPATRFFGQRTPRVVNVLIVLLLLASLVAGLGLTKQLLFPFSKTTPEYILWVANGLSVWTGYLFWVLFVVLYVLIPTALGRKVKTADLSGFAQRLLSAVPERLGKLAVSIPVLSACGLLLAGLAFEWLEESQVPAPPRAGELVIPTDPRTPDLLYQAIGAKEGNGNNFVALFDRKEMGSTLFPRQVLRLGDAQRITKIAVSSDQKRIYVLDPDSDVVHVINGASPWREEKPIPVGKTARSIALSADGRKLYVGVEGPIPLGKIVVLNTTNLEEMKSIGEVGCPEGLFAASGAPLLFVATQCGAGNDPLYVIDTRNDTVIKRIPGFAVGWGVIATPDARIVFVSSGDGVSHVNMVRNYMQANPEIIRLSFPNLTALALSPDGRLLLVGTTVEGQKEVKSLIVGFDASTGRQCGSVGLDEAPSDIAIAQDGALLASLPHRIFVGDSNALRCQ